MRSVGRLSARRVWNPEEILRRPSRGLQPVLITRLALTPRTLSGAPAALATLVGIAGLGDVPEPPGIGGGGEELVR